MRDVLADLFDTAVMVATMLACLIGCAVCGVSLLALFF